MTTPDESFVELRDGRFKIRVLSAGVGDPILFVHGAGGLFWDPFLDALAAGHRVIAPEHPGAGDSQGLEHVEDLWDLVLYYNELLDVLGVSRATLVGHSFGGMVAAEIAANNPERVDRLVLIAPIGLWLDEHPVPDISGIPPEQLPGLVLADPEGPLAAMLPAPDPTDPEALFRAAMTMASILQFIWPLPDKGLHKRLYRVKAPTLVVWGAEDRLVHPAYGDDVRGGHRRCSPGGHRRRRPPPAAGAGRADDRRRDVVPRLTLDLRPIRVFAAGRVSAAGTPRSKHSVSAFVVVVPAADADHAVDRVVAVVRPRPLAGGRRHGDAPQQVGGGGLDVVEHPQRLAEVLAVEVDERPGDGPRRRPEDGHGPAVAGVVDRAADLRRAVADGEPLEERPAQASRLQRAVDEQPLDPPSAGPVPLGPWRTGGQFSGDFVALSGSGERQKRVFRPT